MASQRVSTFGTTIFTEMSRLAQSIGAVNLGQGFPDFDGPDAVRDAAIDAIRGGVNQYAITTGAVALREAIASHAQRFYGQVIDPMTQVTVTSGATEAIFDAMMAFVDPGDEVVLFEPFYDSYQACVQMAGGIAKYVRLRPPDSTHLTWWFDEAELAAAFSSKTSVVMVNTPNNPTGKVFTSDELTVIGALAKKHGAVIVSDEVYEHLVFAPAKFVRPATVGDLGERTLTISSGGKSFSFTGWKVGWALGPAELVAAVQKAHQWVTFAVAAPLQAAMAKALALPDSYFTQFQSEYVAKRDFLAKTLTAAKLPVLRCDGAYFLIADIAGTGHADDLSFTRWLLNEKKVASIPASIFFSEASRPVHAKHFVRFAFCKTEATLQEAARRLG